MTFMSNTKENILKNVFVLTIKLNVSNVVLDLTGFHYLKKTQFFLMSLVLFITMKVIQVWITMRVSKWLFFLDEQFL